MNRGSTSVGGCSVGMQDVTTALNSVDLIQGRKRFVGPRDAGLIRAAEDALGVQFPPTYRAFLERLGAGSIRGREVYGVIDADFQESTIPDGIWLTLRERQDSELPKSLVIVHNTGDGDYVAIDTSRRPILRIRWSRGIRASQRGTRSSKRSVTTSDNSSWSSFERQQTDSAPHACQGGTARPLKGRLIARSSPRLVGAASTCGEIRLVVVSDLPPLRVKENSQPGKSALQTDVAVTLG